MYTYSGCLDIIVRRFPRLPLPITTDPFESSARYGCVMTDLDMYWPAGDIGKCSGEARIPMPV